MAPHHGLHEEPADTAPLLTVHFDALHELDILLLIEMNSSLLDIGLLSGLPHLGESRCLLSLVISCALLSNQYTCCSCLDLC